MKVMYGGMVPHLMVYWYGMVVWYHTKVVAQAAVSLLQRGFATLT